MSVASDLVNQITSALTEAKREEARREQELDAAKLALAEAREETRKLDRMLRMLENKTDGVTKDQARSAVMAAIQRIGPLPEEKLAEEVSRLLTKQDAPRKGLPLMLNLLRQEFADGSGVWTMPHESGKSA